jgi:hypothetical protein
VLVEQIDDVGLKPLERGFGDPLDMFWPAVHEVHLQPTVGIVRESELGRDHHLASVWCKRFADEFLVCERAIRLSCIEECHAALECRPNQGNPRLLVYGGPVAMAQSHAAESDCRDFQVALSKFALLHSFSSDGSAIQWINMF